MSNRIFLLLVIISLFSSCSTQKTEWTNQKSLGNDSPQILNPNPSIHETSSKKTRDKALKMEAVQNIDQTEILWDKWGVPHIYAQNTD